MNYTIYIDTDQAENNAHHEKGARDGVVSYGL